MTPLPILLGLLVFHPLASSVAEQGHWELSMNHNRNATIMKKSMYKGSVIAVKIHCEGNENENPKLNVRWSLYYFKCSNIMFSPAPAAMDPMTTYLRNVAHMFYDAPVESIACDHILSLTDRTEELLQAMNLSLIADAAAAATTTTTTTTLAPSVNGTLSRKKRAAIKARDTATKKAIVSTDKIDASKIGEIGVDGVYVFTLQIVSQDLLMPQYNLSAFVWMKGPYGFLSVIDWPLLPFYGTMCIIYILYGFIWFVLCARNWRDLLRIQLWIGAIIVLGMLEKAVFFAEYESLNVTGVSVPGAVVFAELVSCMKRALARMLVVIISLGFGIVKPRLGAMLHKIVGMGVLYFVLASIEGSMRALQVKTGESKKELLAAVPLAILDASICWWIFSSLIQVMRTLRLRRNLVKLSLYRHFTNTLIFAVIASIGFMAWSVKQHKMQTCITDWKELWVDEAFWHLLFSIILMVIMVLWRPTNTNQRYAFSAITDTMDEQDEAPLMNDSFDGMKMRGSDTTAAKRSDPKMKAEEDLKWIEENIPASVADVALPNLLDSDEEVMTTKFEMSKME